jgi:metallo-beta-lactamase class B
VFKWIPPLLLTALLVPPAAALAIDQSEADSPEAHVAAARRAAGKDWPALLGNCAPPTPNSAVPSSPSDFFRAPPRSKWYAEPAKVFDNLYFVGQKADYSAWAVKTSQGIILIDSLWDYSVKNEIVDGLRKLGFDSKSVKYVILTHGHVDHAGGAKYLQDQIGARIIASAAEWDLIPLNTEPWPKPRRDLIATDGQKLTLGDTTLTLYLTPGHTPGTLSLLIPVTDRGTPHLVAEVGGTGFNFTITPGTSETFWFETYIRSVERFRDIASKAGADSVISNHRSLDGTSEKLTALASRRNGDPNAYVVGTDAVRRYLTVLAECATAELLRRR